MKTTKKAQPTDATLRNVKASARRDESLLARIQRLEQFAQSMAPNIWRKAGKARP